jgi:hypothetical protein
MARKVDEAANFVFVQLIEQEPGIYDKRHADYARREFLMRWRLVYVYIITKTNNRIQIQNMSAKTIRTDTTMWPVLCDTSQQLG